MAACQVVGLGPGSASATSGATTAVSGRPRETPETRGRRGRAIAARKQALAEWSATNPDLDYHPELFRDGAWSGLGNISYIYL